MSDDYCVAIYARPDDPQALRDVIARELAMHTTDAMIHAHAAPGVLPDRLPRAKAVALAQAVSALGVPAEAIAADDLFEFPRHDMVHHAQCLEEGLEILEAHGAEVTLVRWEEIALINVGEVPDGVTRHWLPTHVIAAGPHHEPASFQTAAPAGLQVWIVARRPWRAFRIDHRQMNYEYLGSRMSLSATHNFRLFVEDLVRHSPGAARTPSTAAYLEHGSPRELQFESDEAFRRDSQFAALIVQRREAGGGS